MHARLRRGRSVCTGRWCRMLSAKMRCRHSLLSLGERSVWPRHDPPCGHSLGPQLRPLQARVPTAWLPVSAGPCAVQPPWLLQPGRHRPHPCQPLPSARRLGNLFPPPGAPTSHVLSSRRGWSDAAAAYGDRTSAVLLPPPRPSAAAHGRLALCARVRAHGSTWEPEAPPGPEGCKGVHG